MPVRNVVNRSGRGFRGHFPSRKMKKMIGWESILERYAIYLFEFSPGVLSYCAQPELVYYPDGTDLRKYYPDFKITTTGGISVRIEVNSRDPLEEARRPLKRVEQSPPPDLPAGLDDDLPDFPPIEGDKS